MNTFLLIGLFTILIIFIICICGSNGNLFENLANDITKLRSPVDNYSYRVNENFNDKLYAANLLAELNQRSTLLLKYMKAKYVAPGETVNNNNGPYDYVVIRLLERYNPDNILEIVPEFNSKDTSYTKNKKILHICLRSKDNKRELLDINTLFFVYLHELAHIGSVSIGHGDNEFWANFKFLLKNAVEIGLYHPVDYKFNPKLYCGLTIQHNPLYDNGIYMQPHH